MMTPLQRGILKQLCESCKKGSWYSVELLEAYDRRSLAPLLADKDLIECGHSTHDGEFRLTKRAYLLAERASIAHLQLYDSHPTPKEAGFYKAVVTLVEELIENGRGEFAAVSAGNELCLGSNLMVIRNTVTRLPRAIQLAKESVFYRAEAYGF